MSFKQFSILLLLASLFGASFLFIKIASPSLGPLFLIESRVGIAAISLIIFARLLKQKIEIKYKWKELMILGAINAAIPFVLIAYAELNLSASLAAIINSTTPLFSVIISILWLKEGKNMRTFLGIIMGCIGVGILVGWSPIQLNVKVILSIVAISLAALFYGIGGVYSKRAFQDMKSFDLAIGQQLGASIVLLPFALLDMPNKLPSIGVTISVLGLAVFSTSVAYLLYFYLIKNIGPTKTVSVTLLVPIFGIIWGVLFLDERTTLSTYIGLSVVLMSILLVSNTKQKVSNIPEQVVK
ncbi:MULTISPECIES: DMT family transporter [Bacillus]|uniref:DMT family transporter n=1 Tax=Bacillus TaxID=1386 RepID=UPI0003B00DFE|nr:MULTISPECIES: EamA family transporter [Bacillus]AIU83208.1 putative inner membrane transporter yiJE [Bacillus velezensis]ASK59773.1 EamA family transporter [Bacillus velezensis]ATD74407.1 putative cystine transporter YijE [Bacillus velezensis]ATV24137.1 EamA family transporter [Bacillus sp. Lzh-5]KAF1276401.1 EamA family transporter [Bacillus amyloliquefaciens]